ncbi:MAG: formylglycine-generating enzyme family protein [Bacteroidia bacterium]
MIGLTSAFADVKAYSANIGENKSIVHTGMVKIPEGYFAPFFKTYGGSKIKVPSFYLDIYPVTNQEFLAFVKANPIWSKSKVNRLFADTNYLKDWKSDFNFGGNLSNAPVTNVSWFAANAYCKWKGKRLPTLAEWEYVSAANPIGRNSYDTVSLATYILNWYNKPTPKTIPAIHSTFENKLGVWDMNGLVWEWIFDFNIPSSSSSTCAGISIGVVNKENYAAFLRYSFRSSLKANYAVRDLGFRCAMDASK